jgi:mRNA interferase HigB
MNVIAPRTLRAFWEKHPHAETPLREWQKDVQKSDYANFAELRATYPSADYLADAELTIFNIGGNKYRLVTFVRYSAQTIFIKRVMTHAEYTKWNAQGRPI